MAPAASGGVLTSPELTGTAAQWTTLGRIVQIVLRHGGTAAGAQVWVPLRSADDDVSAVVRLTKLVKAEEDVLWRLLGDPRTGRGSAARPTRHPLEGYSAVTTPGQLREFDNGAGTGLDFSEVRGREGDRVRLLLPAGSLDVGAWQVYTEVVRALVRAATGEGALNANLFAYLFGSIGCCGLCDRWCGSRTACAPVAPACACYPTAPVQSTAALPASGWAAAVPCVPCVPVTR